MSEQQAKCYGRGMDLHEFAIQVGVAVVLMDEVAAMNRPGSSLSDSEFIGVTTEDGKQFSIHIQETE